MSITPELLDEIEARARAAFSTSFLEEDHLAYVTRMAPSTTLALVAHVRKIEREKDELAADARGAKERVASLDEPYVDDRGTAWLAPTAWAYAQSCKQRDALTAKLETDRRLAASELSHVMSGWKSAMERAKSERDELAAKLEEAKEALKPFKCNCEKHGCLNGFNMSFCVRAKATDVFSRLTAEPAKGGE